MHRLRQKLKEYYEAEGGQDPVLVDLPRGSYSLRFEAPQIVSERSLFSHDSHSSQAPPDDTAVASYEAPTNDATESKHTLRALIHSKALIAGVSALGLIAGALGAIGWRTIHVLASRQFARPAAPADPVIAFWSKLLANDPRPIIAYANAVFLLDESDDMFRFRAGANDNRGTFVDSHLARLNASNPGLVARAGQLYYENGYTGTGELRAVAMLTELFTKMGKEADVQSSRYPPARFPSHPR